MARAQQLLPSFHTMHDDELVDASIVARALSISPRQVGRLKDLPVVEISERCHRYRVGAVRGWLASRTRNRTAAA